MGGRKVQVYRCRTESTVGLHVMSPQARCYTFEHNRLKDVTRQVRC